MFEIKVVLLGYVSAGKSTVLNALLQDHYCEVAMRRSTAGIDFFRLHVKSGDEETEGSTRDDRIARDESEVDSTGNVNKRPKLYHTASDTLREITQQNVKLRQSQEIQESKYDVQLDEPLCDMRPDTKLVLIDVPGLNEAGSKDKYRDYVNDKWDTFDCVIAVMDVHQGVNTEEQIQLLELIQANLVSKKRLPVIVLCNKVDNLYDDEVMMLVDEVRTKGAEIFQSPTRTDTASAQDPNTMAAESIAAPVFIPLSAKNAFIYRIASRLCFDDFKQLDKTIIEQLGHDEMGRSKWNVLSPEEKLHVAYKAVHSETNFVSLEATNFHQFQVAFCRCVGEPVQRDLIQLQLLVTLKSLSFESSIAAEFRKIHEINKRLGMPQTPYPVYFWKAYEAHSSGKIELFLSDMDCSGLHVVMKQLIEYYNFVAQVEGKYELLLIVNRMVELVRLFIHTSLRYERKSDGFTQRSSLIATPLIDWDASMFCWVDLTTCSDCTKGFECRNLQHVSWNPATGDVDKWEFYAKHPYHRKGGWRHKDSGDFVQGVKHQNIQLPPVDNAHHWKRCREGWENKFTNTVVVGEHNPVAGKVGWKTLTPRDFCTINESLLLLSYSKSFGEYFGREKVLLECNVQAYNDTIRRLSNVAFYENDGKRNLVGRRTHAVLKALQVTYDDDGSFAPEYSDKYHFVAQIKMPKRLSNPKHWGHLICMFCEFLDSK